MNELLLENSSLPNDVVKKFNEQFFRFYETGLDTRYDAKVIEQVEATRRSGMAFMVAVYKLNNNPKVLPEDKVNPCIQGL